MNTKDMFIGKYGIRLQSNWLNGSEEIFSGYRTFVSRLGLPLKHIFKVNPVDCLYVVHLTLFLRFLRDML